MTLTSADLLHLSYTPDLTEAGLAFALRSLPLAPDDGGSSPYDTLRRLVAGVAVELAFRRYLSRHEVPFEVQTARPFTARDRYDVSLGGHRCEIKPVLITQREKVSTIRRDPQTLLSMPAIIASNELEASGSSGQDLYLFAYVLGLIAASQTALKKAAEMRQPCYMLHLMDAEWCQPPIWKPLGPLVLKSESVAPLQIEISGQDQGREYLKLNLRLPPRSEVLADGPFYALTALQAASIPTARLEVRSLERKETHSVRPREWNNIWVYGMDIYLAGFISCQDFHERARSLAPNSRGFQIGRAREKNLALEVPDLNPLSSLFEQVRAWDRDRTH